MTRNPPAVQQTVLQGGELTETQVEGVVMPSLDPSERGLPPLLDTWLEKIGPGNYVAVQAFLAPSATTTAALQDLRRLLRDRYHVATMVDYGPRYLHATGQLHKGGPKSGVFLQLLDEPSEHVPVPETEYDFGTLVRAQARSDHRTLQERDRRILRIHLGEDPVAGLETLRDLLG